VKTGNRLAAESFAGALTEVLWLCEAMVMAMKVLQAHAIVCVVTFCIAYLFALVL
jgi:hypothetical protein